MGVGRGVSFALIGDVACGELGDVVVFVAAGVGGSLGGGGAKGASLCACVDDVYSSRAYDML